MNGDSRWMIVMPLPWISVFFCSQSFDGRVHVNRDVTDII